MKASLLHDHEDIYLCPHGSLEIVTFHMEWSSLELVRFDGDDDHTLTFFEADSTENRHSIMYCNKCEVTTYIRVRNVCGKLSVVLYVERCDFTPDGVLNSAKLTSRNFQERTQRIVLIECEDEEGEAVLGEAAEASVLVIGNEKAHPERAGILAVEDALYHDLYDASIPGTQGSGSARTRSTGPSS